jgi:hypothetical protein
LDLPRHLAPAVDLLCDLKRYATYLVDAGWRREIEAAKVVR